MAAIVATVSQLNKYIAIRIRNDEKLRGITVKGEISNFTNHIKSGHYYFTLKDESSSVKCVMFRGNAVKLPFVPENGQCVLVRGDVNVFERDGVYQLYATSIEPDGVGALYLAFEQLKQKLSQEGLFDPAHKKPIPRTPAVIGVVTSPTGAALQDILNILRRRYPIGTVKVFPALVQGIEAPQSICRAIRAAQDTDCDVLIVGRGGGSMEDLWCFNDEMVARTIFASHIPVISAVGHEIDFTIADFAADLRAPTPSAAAELATEDVTALSAQVDSAQQQMAQAILRVIAAHGARLDVFRQRLDALSPSKVIDMQGSRTDALLEQLSQTMHARLRESEVVLMKRMEMLQALSPLGVLLRGYAIAFQEGKALRSVAGIETGDIIDVRLADGSLRAKVEAVATVERNQNG